MLEVNKIKCARCGEYKSARSYDMSRKLAICNKCFDKKPYITADELTFDRIECYDVDGEKVYFEDDLDKIL